MDKEKLAKEASEIVRKFFLNDAYLPLLTEDWLETDFNRLSEKLADRIEIDREQLNFLPMIASMLKVFKDYTYQSITEVMFKDMINSIIRECPIKIKEEEADDEKT